VWTVSGGGGGGSPAGSPNDIQWNNAGSFGGGRCTMDSSSNIVCLGSISTGSGGGTTGKITLNGGTSGACNLTTTATGTAITPSTAGECDGGTTALPLFNNLFIAGTSGTPASNSFKLTGASTGGLRTVTIPDASFTIAQKSQLVRSIGAVFTNNGSGVSTANSAPFVWPLACTISAWNISVAPSGTATVAVWKIAAGTAIPTVANSINTSGVSLASGTSIRSTTLSDFTTLAVAANDIFIISLTAVGGSPTAVNFSVECDQ